MIGTILQRGECRMNVVENPAETVLDTYLLDCMHNPIADRAAYEFEADLLYLLTDGTAHRRAMLESSLTREIVALRALEPETQNVTGEHIDGRLRGLIARRVLCKAVTEGGENE